MPHGRHIYAKASYMEKVYRLIGVYQGACTDVRGDADL